jgi:serine protease Do
MVNKSLSFMVAAVCVVASSVGLAVYTHRTPSQQDWQDIEQKAQSAVVQVLAQVTEFNWLDPYKAPGQSQGAGTAFFIDKEGYLLTNFHVIDQAKSIHLQVPGLGQKCIEASIVGVCPEADIALLKVSDEGHALIKKELGHIPYLILGDSDSLYPTEPVLALGYPLGQRYIKSTVGVVAGLEYIGGSSFVHITAPLNPGNSGGPLLNKAGEVIGVNSAIMPHAQNIGYIVPMAIIKILLEDLRTTKLLRKPALGIYCNHATDEHAQILNNPLPAGVYINDVTKNSVADKAGIKPGDMLYKINGYTVDQYGDVTVNWRSSSRVTLTEFLIRFPLRAELELVLYREGTRMTIKCTLDEPHIYPIRSIYPDYEPHAIDYELIGGLCIAQLRTNHFSLLPPHARLQNYMLQDNQDKEALVVTGILPGSYMHKSNCFYHGTLLDTVNGKEVKNLSDLRAALKLSVQTGRIDIVNKDKVKIVVSLDRLLQDEDRIARDFMFSITDTVQKLKLERQAFYAQGSGGQAQPYA